MFIFHQQTHIQQHTPIKHITIHHVKLGRTYFCRINGTCAANLEIPFLVTSPLPFFRTISRQQYIPTADTPKM